MKAQIAEKIFDFLNILFFAALAIIMLYPLWYVIMYSFSDPNIVSLGNMYLRPTKFTLATYEYMLRQRTIYSGIKNSIFVTVVGTLINLTALYLTAYPLSRDNFTGRKYILAYFIFTMLFNGGMVPTYLVVRGANLVNSLWALVIPNALSVYYMLILIKFFKTIPESLFESAKLDGASELYIVFKIVLPLSLASLASIGLFCAVGHWNSYLSAMLYLNKVEKFPLQYILYGMLSRSINPGDSGFKDLRVTPMNIKMAAVVISLVPILLVYPFIQKYFMSGVMLGSVKG